MPRSLRVRLLLSAAIAIFLALAAAWVTMTVLFERHIEHRIEGDLIRDGLQLAAALSVGADGTPALEHEPGDSRFFEPASGLYWQVSTPQGALNSRSLWDQHLPEPKNATSLEWKIRTVEGPFNQQVLLVERYIRPERAGADVLVQLAHEQRSLHEAREEFGEELALFLGDSLVHPVRGGVGAGRIGLATAASRAQRSRNIEAQSSRAHGRRARCRNRAAHAGDQRARRRPRKDLSRARRRAADLAHGLKTPLAALSAQSRRAREAGATDAADGLDQAIAAATSAIEGELARSRAAAIRAAPSGDTTLALPLIESLVGVVEKTEFGAKLVFQVNIPEELPAGGR